MFKAKESTPNKANTLSRGKCQGIVFSGRGADKKHNANTQGLHSMLSNVRMSVTSSNTGNNLGGLFDVSRRLIAMPFMAFSFCALSRTHGVNASICFDGHANWESLTGLLFSVMTVRQPDWCCPPTLGGVVAFINK